ncbi:MAG: deoxyribodipyrimidine photo-lyase, partial [Syntrophorhabdaceae bacterium]|nr:deoxyribodipyrimidine photo-lyase [Syntrophorhabdaceae bacterium]
MDNRRIRLLKHGIRNNGPVAYWMSRDQRVRDNWALIFAQSLAIELRLPLCVVFCLMPQFLNATLRQYDFMLKGLYEVASGLMENNIPFFLVRGLPEKEIPQFIKTYNISTLVTDFDPLKIKREWKKRVSENINITFFEVDTHNIVPCWFASNKQEYAAFTIRTKINRLMKDFLTEFPQPLKHPFPWGNNIQKIDWKSPMDELLCDRSIKPVSWIKPGEREAYRVMENFIKKGLNLYHIKRNDPNFDGQSSLSPYLHFGQISAQRIALEIEKADISNEAKKVFLEELIIRRELSDNYCFYNENYDRFEGFPLWAKKTLNEHRKDKRPYVYSLKEFEEAKTHDPLWNAAQLEMVKKGKMHGYMRMYWAKKILEWSPSPEEAIYIAI